MLKLKTTKKSILDSGLKVYQAGYCSLQNLLYHEQANAYTAGIYGWNSDIYFIENIIISTGYRPFGDPIDYELMTKYETAAEQIRASGEGWEERRQKTKILLGEFVKELKEATA